MRKMKKDMITVIFAVLTMFLSSTALAVPIPDTGQNGCYDTAGDEMIPCPAPGESYYGQDGQYNINAQSYTKLDENVYPHRLYCRIHYLNCWDDAMSVKINIINSELSKEEIKKLCPVCYKPFMFLSVSSQGWGKAIHKETDVFGNHRTCHFPSKTLEKFRRGHEDD